MKLPVNDGDDPIAVIDALKIELKRLRRVIDWACCYPDDRFVTPGIRQVFVEELRRRADTDLTQLTEKGEGGKGVNDPSLNAGVVDPPPCLQCARFKEKLDRIRVLFSAFRYGGPVDGKKIKAWDIAVEIETLTE